MTPKTTERKHPGNLIDILSTKSTADPFDTRHKLTTFLNPYSYQIARKSLEIFTNFDAIHCDGIALVYALRALGIPATRRSFDMTSMACEVFENANKRSLSLFLIGSTPFHCRRAKERIATAYPNIKILGFRDGYFASNEDRLNTLHSIKNLNPDIVITGMGTPLQERLLIDLTSAGWRGHGYTCGGFIHQLSKSGLSYYPQLFDKLNIRWLYRILDEPKLLKRYLLLYPLFIPIFIKDALTRK